MNSGKAIFGIAGVVIFALVAFFGIKAVGTASEPDFEVKQNASGYFEVYMLGESLFQIETNPCDSIASTNIDPNGYLGGKWNVQYFRLPDPEGDVVVIYFEKKPLKMVPLLKRDGSHFLCP